MYFEIRASGHSTRTGRIFFQNSESPVCPLTVWVAKGDLRTSMETTPRAGVVVAVWTVPGTVKEIVWRILFGPLEVLVDFLQWQKVDRSV